MNGCVSQNLTFSHLNMHIDISLPYQLLGHNHLKQNKQINKQNQKKERRKKD